VQPITIEPATEQEIADTVAVMGGEDWEMWMTALLEAGAIAPGATALAYDYIGPEVTWPIYHNGTIGRAKLDLRAAARRVDAALKVHGYGRAFISVNKALVTQASSAIPVVPLYIAILYRVMKERGSHECTIEQIQRLFATQLYNGRSINFDPEGRARIDDLEMRPEIQKAVAEIWPRVTTENLRTITDFNSYETEFLKLFGFGLPGVNYEADEEPNVPLDA
jgi:enoyl-[acyl-carrier protein] reductase/trans-2-enoyl-CoA reductase (NAD+)